jgi:DNA ligase-1
MKPMLLPREMPDLDTIEYPIYITPKLDGIRCLIKDGVALSRTLKPIPNKQIQRWAKHHKDLLEGMDGELIVGSPTSPTVYRDTNSFVMSHDKEGEFDYYHFDMWNDMESDYTSRTEGYIPAVPGNYRKLINLKAVDKEHVLTQEQFVIELGYEGLVLRNPKGKYKYGRCTIKEANAFKLKRFEDSEAIITGFIEEMHNGNDATENELGRTKRSTAKAGLSGKGSLGACTVRDVVTGIEFQIGSGFTAEERTSFWEQRQSLTGMVVKYKYFPIGIKDKPRHPIYLGFRDTIDL